MSTAFAAFNLLIFASVFAFLPLLIGVYVYRDAKRRNMNAPLWTIIAILAPSLIGFIMKVLPEDTLIVMPHSLVWGASADEETYAEFLALYRAIIDFKAP